MQHYTSETAIRTLLIGPCGWLRRRLGAGDSMRKIDVVGEYRTGTSALALGLRHNPQLVLMDLVLPDRRAVCVCRDILVAAPEVRVLFVGDADGELPLLESIFAGADGYLSKDIDTMRLLDVCARVAAGQPIVDPAMLPALLRQIRARVVRATGRDVLTPQERRILQLVSKGRTNKEIADMLGLSAKTVKNYLSNVYQKLHVTSRTQAALLFSQSGAP